jgi:hypothetical protein
LKNLLEDYIQALEEYRVPGEALKITRAITKAPVFANPLRRWKRCYSVPSLITATPLTITCHVMRQCTSEYTALRHSRCTWNKFFQILQAMR